HGDGSGVHARLLQLRPDAALSAIVLHELLEVVVDASAALPDPGGQPTAPGQVTAALAAEVAPVVAPGHRHAARRAPGRCRRRCRATEVQERSRRRAMAARVKPCRRSAYAASASCIPS